MECNIMVLPSSRRENIRVLRIPRDMERQEAFRHATGVIAEAEETAGGVDWDAIYEALEDRGFEAVDFILGPSVE